MKKVVFYNKNYIKICICLLGGREECEELNRGIGKNVLLLIKNALK